MKDYNEKAKGEFQHRMFKLVILIIVFIFCSLIAGFIYITITSSSSSKKTLKIIDNNYQTEESILQSNEQYYSLLKSLDENFYNLINKLNKTQLLMCDKNKFYIRHISSHTPCIYKYNSSDDIPILDNIKNNNFITSNFAPKNIDFIDKFMKLISIEYYNKNNGNEEYFKNPRLDNIGRVIINNSNKKVHILISPISQIEYFNSFQNKSSSDIINIYLKNNIDVNIKDKLVNGEKKIIYYEFNLNQADFLYIPSYYFIQIKESIENLVSYEYQDISLFNDMVYKILYTF